MKTVQQFTILLTLLAILTSPLSFSQTLCLSTNPDDSGTGEYDDPIFYKNFKIDSVTGTVLYLYFFPGNYIITDTTCFLKFDRSFGKIVLEGLGDNVIINGDTTSNKRKHSKWGFLFQIKSIQKNINQIIIKNLNFKNFRVAGIQTELDGDITTKNFKNIIIENCEFDSLLGFDSVDSQSAHIKLEGTDNVIIRNNIIKNSINTPNQTDGIVAKRTSNLFIENNNIELKNNHYFIRNDSVVSPHADCIQIYGNVYNLQINGNIIRNKSIIGVTPNKVYTGSRSYRTGIIMQATTGYIRIFNNVIESAKGNDLINTRFSSETTEASYLNNTFVGLNDQEHLLFFGDYFPETSSYLKIKNNIFNKRNTSNLKDIIKFDGFDSSNISCDNISHNTYFFTNPNNTLIDDPTFFFTLSGKKKWSEIEDTTLSFIANPGFIDTINYNIYHKSPCKNKGVFTSLTKKDIKGNNRPNWLMNSKDIGAYELPDAQIRIKISGTQIIQNLTHTLNYVGSYWENMDSIRLTTNSSYNNVTYVSNIDTDTLTEPYINGFSYKYVLQSEDINNKLLGIGFIKITASTGAYFYLDTRHFDKATNPSIVITFNTESKSYFNGLTEINNGTVLRLWELLNESPKTSYLENFWSNSLVVLRDGNNPRFFWSAYPDNIVSVTNYLLYKKDGGMDEVFLDTLASNTFTYKDFNAFYNSPPFPGHNISYRLKARGYMLLEPESPNYVTGFSNQVSIIAAGEDPAKRLGNIEGIIKEFKLYQNYPNPFNPSTKIYFDLKEKGNVELSVYNVVGELIKVFVNEELDKGSYNVLFEANDLPSGIYFYSLQTPLFKKTNKMILIK